MSEENSKYKSISVLIVDDSDFSRKLLNDYISEAGYNVVGEAANAEETIKIVTDRKVDIAIIDVVMPKVSGIELTETLCKSLSKLSVIMISSLAQESIILNSISAGAVDFIQKPINKDVLLNSLAKISDEIFNG